jgi:hypothetical protein
MNGAQDLRDHAFFAGVDWVKAANCQLKPPFKPNVKFEQDTSNFDTFFSNQAPLDSFV